MGYPVPKIEPGKGDLPIPTPQRPPQRPLATRKVSAPKARPKVAQGNALGYPSAENRAL